MNPSLLLPDEIDNNMKRISRAFGNARQGGLPALRKELDRTGEAGEDLREFLHYLEEFYDLKRAAEARRKTNSIRKSRILLDDQIRVCANIKCQSRRLYSRMSDLNSSFNIYHDAADAALENATDWLNLAEYALKSRTTGHAAALAIIANEEITKAYACYIVAEGLMSENTTELKTLFRDHYAKTEQMLGFYLIATLATHAQMGLIDPNEFLKNILTASPREVALAEVQLDKQLRKSAGEIQRRRTQGMYIGIKRERGKLIVKKPKNVRRSRAESTIQTVKDYHELVSMIVKTIRNHPEARKFFKEYLDMIITESRQKVTLDFEV